MKQIDEWSFFFFIPSSTNWGHVVSSTIAFYSTYLYWIPDFSCIIQQIHINASNNFLLKKKMVYNLISFGKMLGSAIYVTFIMDSCRVLCGTNKKKSRWGYPNCKRMSQWYNTIETFTQSSSFIHYWIQEYHCLIYEFSFYQLLHQSFIWYCFLAKLLVAFV